MRDILILNFILLSFISCNKDESRTSILGSWTCEAYSEQSGQTTYYTTSIVQDPISNDDSNRYIIYNFHNIGSGIGSEVHVSESEKGKLIIGDCENIDFLFIGEGVISDDFSEIIWLYNVNAPLGNSNIRATYQ